MSQDEFDESFEDKPRRLTNIEIIEKIMTFSRYGGLVQVFIMLGVEAYCDEIICEKPEEIDKSLKGFVSADIWKGIATEVKQKLKDLRKE